MIHNAPLSRPSIAEFVRLEGLQKLTSVTAHDWDTYIFKELVDNALDADEAERGEHDAPRVQVEMVYSHDAEERDHWFEITVRNRTPFPLASLQAIFDLERRVSSKDLYNLPTRGAQGNALKTILGIPYGRGGLAAEVRPLHEAHPGQDLLDPRRRQPADVVP